MSSLISAPKLHLVEDIIRENELFMLLTIEESIMCLSVTQHAIPVFDYYCVVLYSFYYCEHFLKNYGRVIFFTLFVTLICGSLTSSQTYLLHWDSEAFGKKGILVKKHKTPIHVNICAELSS